MEKMKEEKSEMYRKLKNKRNSKEYEWYFLRYVPAESDEDYEPEEEPKKKKKKRRKGKKKKKRKTKKKKKTFLSRLGFGGRKTRRRNTYKK
tara:strand:- start:76 stop:348 length:273 start_codon:yes stop_codon:yes gene_type:complete